MVLVFALLSALSYGSADFLGGFSSRNNSPITVVAWSQAAGLAIVLICAPFMGGADVSVPDILWGMAAGIAGAMGVLLLFHGLSTALVSIISPVAALVGAVFPTLFGILIGERPSLLSWAGVCLALPAILLLSWEKNEHANHVARSLRLGVLSGLMFGGFFILISRSSDSSGMWPLAAARATTVPLFMLMSLWRNKSVGLQRGTTGVTWLSGALDMAANIFYLLAARTGYIILAAVLTALYPAPTVLMQRIFLKENLSPMRIAGLLLSICGAALIGIG